jgi:hypothetical protein
MKLFLLRRLLGLAQIANGAVVFFTPWNPGLPLKVARHIAREKGKRLYGNAKRVDEWPYDNESGDAIRAGLDALKEKR